MDLARSHIRVVHQWMFGTSFHLDQLFSNQHNSLRERLDSDNDNDILGQSINKKVDCAEAARTNTMGTFLPSLSDPHP